MKIFEGGFGEGEGRREGRREAEGKVDTEVDRRIEVQELLGTDIAEEAGHCRSDGR